MKLSSLFDRIRLSKAPAPSLSKLQFNLTRRPAWASPDAAVRGGVFPGPGVSPEAPRKAQWARAGPAQPSTPSPEAAVPRWPGFLLRHAHSCYGNLCLGQLQGYWAERTPLSSEFTPRRHLLPWPRGATPREA